MQKSPISNDAKRQFNHLHSNFPMHCDWLIVVLWKPKGVDDKVKNQGKDICAALRQINGTFIRKVIAESRRSEFIKMRLFEQFSNTAAYFME